MIRTTFGSLRGGIRIAVLLAEDLEGPLLEHQPQMGAVMFPAALAVAENGQRAVAVGLQQMVQMDRGGGEEHRCLIAGGG